MSKLLIDPADKYYGEYPMFIIHDWQGNLMDFGSFTSFNEAEAYLRVTLGDDYDTDRQEYDILGVKS